MPARIGRQDTISSHPAFRPPEFKGLGIRNAGFKPGIHEYDAYEYLRKAYMAKYQHCRSAFTRGGILWRLCMDDLDEDVVLYGPTGYSEHEKELEYAGQKFVEDHLTAEEENLIVGVYNVRNCAYITSRAS